VLHLVAGPTEGEHGPVVTLVSVAVEQRGATARAEIVEQSGVSAFADVDDTLEHGHASSVPEPTAPEGAWKQRSAPSSGAGFECRSALVGKCDLAGTTPTKDPSTFPLGPPTPHAVVDVVHQRVFKATLGNGAVGADPLCSLHAEPVARKKGRRRKVAALALGHPFGIHG
jgi:hypothetical protein